MVTLYEARDVVTLYEAREVVVRWGTWSCHIYEACEVVTLYEAHEVVTLCEAREVVTLYEEREVADNTKEIIWMASGKVVVKESFNWKMRMPGTVKCRLTVVYWVQIEGIKE